MLTSRQASSSLDKSLQLRRQLCEIYDSKSVKSVPNRLYTKYLLKELISCPMKMHGDASLGFGEQQTKKGEIFLNHFSIGP